MREYVKSWITEWDFKRLAPEDDVEIEVTGFKQNFQEDKDLQTTEPEKQEAESVALTEGAVECQSPAN